MASFTRNSTGAEVMSAFPDALAGKTVVLTGPSENSLAAEAAYVFAAAPQPPARIILLGRTLSKITPVIARIKQLSATAPVDVKFVHVDLSDNRSVRTAADQIRAVTGQQQGSGPLDERAAVDVLVNSAGIMAPAAYAVAAATGIEMQLAANHVGHFLLTGLLRPARVVNLTSMGYAASGFRFDDPGFAAGRAYRPWEAYGQSKTANILFTQELARRAGDAGWPVAALAVHPGIVLASGIMQHTDMDALGPALEEARKRAAESGDELLMEEPKTLAQGCATMVLAAVQPGLEEHSGAFLRDCSIVPESEQKPWIRDPENGKRLWELSEKWVGERFM